MLEINDLAYFGLTISDKEKSIEIIMLIACRAKHIVAIINSVDL
jgi:hypothetical protein